MCFKNIYFEVKNKYKNYVVIMKNGIFYNVLGNDCYLLKNIFNYKINSFSDTVINVKIKSHKYVKVKKS